MTTIRDFVHGQKSDVSAPLALSALSQRFALAEAADFGSDVDVLNYALTLEYLESAFYVQGIAAGLLSGVEKTYIDAIGADEAYHVTAITATIKSLGGTPVSAPGVDFGASYKSRMSFLTASHTFENVGVGAYLGAAGFIKNKTVLQAAAGIFGVEARHAAVVGNLLGLAPDKGVFFGATEVGIAKATVLKDVTPFITAATASPQMTAVPSGPADTGTGSGGPSSTLLGVGSAAIVGAGALAYAAHKRHEADSSES
jgi:hypothetical protein